MRKKLIVLLIVVVLVLSIAAGCSTKEIGANELFKNLNARKAFALGFDKEFIVVDILGDKGDIAADNYVPIGFSFGPAGTDYEGIDFHIVEDVIVERLPIIMNSVEKVLK